jgi:hypothetical protein
MQSIRYPRRLRGRSPQPNVPALWRVALPAWGERYVNVLLRYTLPALAVAVRTMARPTNLYIWTDQEERVKDALLLPENNMQGEVTIRPVPGPDNSFMSMSACHRQALAEAGWSDRVVLLTADMVLSREILATAAVHCGLGKKIICCVAMRTLETANPPIGATGRALLEWGWTNRHRMTRECTWPDGGSYDVWRTYYEQGDEVAARVFLPHPLVVIPEGKRLVFGPTIDVNLTSNFQASDTFLITSPEEGAAVELSPADKEFVITESMATRMNGGPSSPSLIKCTNPRHRMFFSKKVIIKGKGGDVGDSEVVARVLE